MPQACATARTSPAVLSRDQQCARRRPRVCSRRTPHRRRRADADSASRPLNSHTSVPARTGRCRSANSQVARAARIDDDDLQLRPLLLAPARCAGTGSDGTTPCSSRPARPGRPARGLRSRPAPGLRRTRACGRRRPRTCTGASWCRCSPCRCSPSSACWRRSSPRSAAGRKHRTRRSPVRARSMMRRNPLAT